MPTRLIPALLTVLCGCSTTATISLINGGRVEAKIQHGTKDALVLKTVAGVEVPVPRLEISDIDHPGNGDAVLGGLLSAYGALNIATNFETCRELRGDARTPYCIGTFLPASVGVPMLIWGLTTWVSSRLAAASTSPSGYTGVVPSLPPSSPFDFSPSGDSRVPGEAPDDYRPSGRSEGLEGGGRAGGKTGT
ncbi:hypothetical protein HPC49_09780 [Pyxidicoccus fallax]|uniref:Lipoprotein n=1 Tax=Pyxidicoccus fallax TaxID=394095 RepID=A0A848L4H4_9BACT|nr:hypothetical protein [Pyxidicoccus fallax]NMO13516.1 hypothetical protein [Pyxidicoccus fallax]NPC78533.1 hypothetical protein [Pyxidicoccus fallax]